MPTYLYLHNVRTDTEQRRFWSEYELRHVDYELRREVNGRGEITGGDIYLGIDAYNNSLPWGWHAYDAAIGAVGMMGLPGTATATAVDSYVDATKYLNRLVNRVNTELPKKITSQIIVGR